MKCVALKRRSQDSTLEHDVRVLRTIPLAYRECDLLLVHRILQVRWPMHILGSADERCNGVRRAVR